MYTCTIAISSRTFTKKTGLYYFPPVYRSIRRQIDIRSIAVDPFV